jgi:myo-inositol catabolism protein IolC
LQAAGVEPDVWKIEGLDQQSDCEKVVAAVRSGGRHDVGCIILGRGENDEKVGEWLRTAAAVPGFVGFAVGRTSFWDALVEWRDAHLSAKQAAEQIAVRYCDWFATFQAARRFASSASQWGANIPA